MPEHLSNIIIQKNKIHFKEYISKCSVIESLAHLELQFQEYIYCNSDPKEWTKKKPCFWRGTLKELFNNILALFWDSKYDLSGINIFKILSKKPAVKLAIVFYYSLKTERNLDCKY